MATNNSVNVTLSGQTGTSNFVGSTSPTIITPKIAQINDSNALAVMTFNPTATAVNYIAVTNAATLGVPLIQSSGTDSNVSLSLASKATGLISFFTTNTTTPIVFSTGTTYQHTTIFNFPNTAASRTATFQDADGTVAYLADITSAGSLKNIQVFTGNGTYTATSGTNKLIVYCTGAGGGAGGAGSGIAGTGGGGGGGTAILYTTNVSSQTVTIGTGGTGGSGGGTNGNPGGTSSFGALCTATGGSGSTATSTASQVTVGANGGVGSSGTINFVGGCGGIGALNSTVTTQYSGGFGGSSFFGGNASAVINGQGANGSNYGVGGAGSSGMPSTSRAGGTGANGVIVVYEFA